MHKRIGVVAAALLSMTGFAGDARAATMISCSTNQISCSSSSAEIGPSVEFYVLSRPGYFNGREFVIPVGLNIDFSNNMLVLTNIDALRGSGSFSYTMAFKGPSAFTSASIVSQAGTSIVPDAVSIDSGSLLVNLAAAPGRRTGFNQGSGVRIAFTMAAVPEPSTWALMILGFGALGAALRRQRSATPKIAIA